MPLRKLTLAEIERFASRKNVRRIAVENFLMSMGADDYVATQNVYLDAGLYHWNADTVRAIREGIMLAETPAPSDEGGEDQNVPDENTGNFPW